jgi:Family of unknown function (DUF6299)
LVSVVFQGRIFLGRVNDEPSSTELGEEMKVLRLVVSAAVAAMLVPALAVSASAAVVNDTAATATVITSLPSTITQDTTGATTDAVDSALNANCGAPFTNASVWFRYTSPADGGLIADMSGSSYTGGFIITEGDPALGKLVACGPTTVGIPTSAGQAYYIVAFSDTAVNGGNLVVTFGAAPPPPQIAVTTDKSGVAYKDGSAQLSGSYSCTNTAGGFAEIDGSMTQRVGRVKINGSFFVSPLVCDGVVHRWVAVVTSDNGLFRGGKSATVAFAFACGIFECANGYTEQTVQLNSGRR